MATTLTTAPPAQYEPYADHTNKFDSFGEFCLAVRSAERLSKLSGRVDPRLSDLNRRFALHQRAAAAGASEAVPSEGGFLVAPQFANAIKVRIYSTGEILRRCYKFPITSPHSNAARFPQFDESSRATGSRLGGVRVYTVNEADAATPSKPKFMASELTPVKLIGLIECSDELLADSDALERWMIYALGQEITWNLENFVVNGSGQLEPQGILNSPALVTVPAQSGQNTPTIVAANISAMMSAFWAPSLNSPGTCWLANQSCIPQLTALTTTVGTAGSESRLFTWRTSDTDPAIARLAGIPIYFAEYCQPLGNVGDLLLVDLSRYVIGLREAIRNELSMHLLWLSDQAAFRAVLRASGQSIDRCPVVPANGSQSTSPFVALATR
jgi:HK97 family phage major capsid protein